VFEDEGGFEMAEKQMENKSIMIRDFALGFSGWSIVIFMYWLLVYWQFKDSGPAFSFLVWFCLPIPLIISIISFIFALSKGSKEGNRMRYFGWAVGILVACLLSYLWSYLWSETWW